MSKNKEIDYRVRLEQSEAEKAMTPEERLARYKDPEVLRAALARTIEALEEDGRGLDAKFLKKALKAFNDPKNHEVPNA